MNQFINSMQSEWIKTRRSTASWLVIIGGFFIPLIMLCIRLIKNKNLSVAYKEGNFWIRNFIQNWQIMAFFLLPMGVILATSLITQVEYRNNSWKQLHATPQYFSTIFFSKLTVITLMMLQFFLLFNIGIYLSAAIPALLLKGVSQPAATFPWHYVLISNAKFFLDCLPIIVLQYLVSLQFKNFLVPLGFGIILLVAATFGVQWEYGYTIPYTYCLFNFIQISSIGQTPLPSVNFHWMAFAYFVAGIIAGYFFYIGRRDKC